MNKPKIAIFHNYMDNIGGAEMVTLCLAKYLNADVYSTNFDFEKIKQMGGQDLRLHSIGRIPINAPFRQQAALWRFRRLNLSGQYDAYIIAGDWAVSAAVHHKPNIWYVHSPIREIWDLHEYTRNNIVSGYKRPVFDVWVKFNRYLNRAYVKNVDRLLCNSHNTQSRVSKFLGRDSKVVFPPTEVNDYQSAPAGGYWLSVNRLIAHKRIEVQLEAFRQLPDEKLVIIGCYEKSEHFQSYAKRMQELAPDNVTIHSWISRSELIRFYAGCKGVISTALDEDFGLTAVEAMAAGKPMIAPNLGGYRETVVHQQTGFLLDEVTPERLVEAVQSVGDRTQDFAEPAKQRARQFGVEPFMASISRELAELLAIGT